MFWQHFAIYVSFLTIKLSANLIFYSYIIQVIGTKEISYKMSIFSQSDKCLDHFMKTTLGSFIKSLSEFYYCRCNSPNATSFSFPKSAHAPKRTMHIPLTMEHNLNIMEDNGKRVIVRGEGT